MSLQGRGEARRAYLFAFLLTLLGCGTTQKAASPADAPHKPAPAVETRGGTLAERVAGEIRKLRPGTKIEIRGPLDLNVHAPDLLDVHLGNLEAACRQSPESCDDGISHFSRAIVSAGSGELTEKSLFPVLKSQAWIDDTERLFQGKGETKKLASFPLVDDIRIVLVEDSELTTRLLTESDLAEKGWTKERALERALANLKGLSTGFKVQETAPGLYGLAFKNGYDGSTFALHGLWGVLRKEVEGDLIVAPIARDIVLFTGTKNERGMRALLMILAVEKKEPAAPYPITTNLYRWTESGWQRFVPPSD